MQAIEKVLPLPVTPSSVWCLSPRIHPLAEGFDRLRAGHRRARTRRRAGRRCSCRQVTHGRSIAPRDRENASRRATRPTSVHRRRQRGPSGESTISIPSAASSSRIRSAVPQSFAARAACAIGDEPVDPRILTPIRPPPPLRPAPRRASAPARTRSGAADPDGRRGESSSLRATSQTTAIARGAVQVVRQRVAEAFVVRRLRDLGVALPFDRLELERRSSAGA